MTKISTFMLVFVVLFSGVLLFNHFRLAHAVNLSITNNGSASTNEINGQINTNLNINQSNNGNFNNDINANSNTGGNTGGSARTGDASVNVDIRNQFNSNRAGVACCPTNSPTVPSQSQSPSPTPTFSNNGRRDGGDGHSNGDGDGGNNQSAIGGGEVLALSATAGSDDLEKILIYFGTICLVVGYALRRKSNHGA